MSKKFANVRKGKNKCGCVDRYEVVQGEQVIASYPITPGLVYPDARTKAMDYARAVNQGEARK